VALLLLAALGWWALAIGRLRRGLDGDAAGAVAELRWALARLGHQLAPNATLAQLEVQLGRAHGAAASRYVTLLREVRYGTAPGARPGRRERGELRRALAAGGGVRAHLRAVAALPPGAARRVAGDR
jgi:hypothetical protein